MCTVTVVADGCGTRLLCNRDERHTRPEALAPRVRRTSAGLAMFPIDPEGGGTWVAVNDAGLGFALLNDDGAAAGAESRGRIILELLGCPDLAAIRRCAEAVRRAWSPHRLLVADGEQVLELRIGPSKVEVTAHALDRPRLFTSSSLGRALVESPRRALFDRMVLNVADQRLGQEAFHRHRWADEPHLSVHMRRHDAATQSVTAVELAPERLRMRYESTREAAGVPAWMGIERRDRARTARAVACDAA